MEFSAVAIADRVGHENITVGETKPSVFGFTRRKTNSCILLVHHTRKQGSEDKFDMISCTTGADGAFLLQKEKRTGNAATLEISGRDQQNQKLYLIRNMETLLWEPASFSRLADEDLSCVKQKGI